MVVIGVFPKCFTELSEFSVNSVTKIIVITVKGLELAISCVRDPHDTTAPARHMWETGCLSGLSDSLNSLNSLKLQYL